MPLRLNRGGIAYSYNCPNWWEVSTLNRKFSTTNKPHFFAFLHFWIETPAGHERHPKTKEENMKKGLLCLAGMSLSLLSLVACNNTSSSAEDFVCGLVNIGDQTETYTLAHINGFEAAAKKLGIPSENIIYQNNVGEDGSKVTSGIENCLAEGASIVFTNSYGHQDYTYAAAKENKDVTFVADTGDYAALTGLDNFKNAFTNIYEARYVSGVVGGLKLKELVEGKSKDNRTLSDENFDGNNIKIGYVGAYTYAEVISGYTAFYLGVERGLEGATRNGQPVGVTMDVFFTDSWYDQDGEQKAAEGLIDEGCVLIGQHADSSGAPNACQSAYGQGKTVYSVGYNVDMREVAPDAALTSATNNWEVYYEYALGLAMEGKGKEIATDWAKGYAEDAVGITELGKNVAEGTADVVEQVEKDLHDGKLHVFDTSTFTVGGEHITSQKVDFSIIDFSTGNVRFEGEEKETVKKDGDVTYVEESVDRSAPYFQIKIDGINWKNK